MSKIKKIQLVIIAFIIAVAGVVIFDTITHLSRSQKKTIRTCASWWLAKAYFVEPKPPDIVILGSSQLGPLIGSDAYVYDRAIDITDDHRSYVLEHDLQALLKKNYRVFIGALPGVMISDQFFISRALFSTKCKPKLVAITLSPRDFIDKYFSSLDNTEAYTFFSRYINTNLLHNDLDKLATERFSEQISKECSTNTNSEQPALYLGKPFQHIAPADIVIYSDDDYSFKNNTEEYKQRYKDPLSPQLEKQMGYFDSLLKYLAQQQIPVVVFNLPLTASNKKLLPATFWKYYNEHVSETCRKNGADYVSLDQVVLPFEDNQFIDGIHLNLAGGHRLSKTIALFIANKLHIKTFQQLLANDNCLL